MRAFIIGLNALLLTGLCVWQLNRLADTASYDFFPEQSTIPVEFDFSEFAEDEYSERQKTEQVRDWLMLTILSNINLNDTEFNEVTFDLVPVRYGYAEKAATLKYGEFRSQYIGKNTIVALLPPSSEAERLDYLAHIADEHRRNLNFIPKNIQVFEYEMSLDEGLATLSRQEAIATQTLFTESAGYFEKEIKNLNDLKEFMSKAEDVTFAKIESRKFIVGGRKLQNRKYGTITIEDIAAIYQSEKEIKRKLSAFNSKWDNVTYMTEEEGERLVKQMLKEQKEQAIVDGSGFSLDPFYDCEALLKYVQRNKRLFSVLPAQEYREMIAELKNNNSDAVLYALGTIMSQHPEYTYDAEDFLAYINKHFYYQKARYDGFLQGTEVGMTLFYTDLMAKLWGSNFKYTAPKNEIPEFLCNTDVAVSEVFREEARKFNSNRLWFSPDKIKIQMANSGNTVLFSRNASRIYAASSNQLAPGEESTAAAFWSASIDWWNNHYEEVGAYEPEYEKLNAIIKWSVIVTWLMDKYQDGHIRFLKDVSVNRDNWFPDWAKANKNLKFDQWKEINFYEKNFKGSKTEVIPILKSPLTVHGSWITGGVSLADPKMLKNLRSMPQNLKVGGRTNRSFLDYDPYTGNLVSKSGNRFTINNSKTNPNVVMEAAPTSKLRTRFGELSNQRFERQVFSKANGKEITLKQNGISVGELSINANKNGFKVGFKGRSIDKGQNLARKVSDSKNPLETIRKSTEVENSIVLSRDASTGQLDVAVKMRGTDNWMRMKVGETTAVELGSGWHSRVAGNSSFSKNCKLQWLSETELMNNYVGKWVSYNPKQGLKAMRDGKPSGDSFRSFKLEIEGKTYNAQFNPTTKDVMLGKADMQSIGPRQLQQRLRSSNIDEIAQLAQKEATGIFNYRPRSDLSSPSNLLKKYGNKNSRQVADDLAKAENPAALKKQLAEGFEANMKHGDNLMASRDYAKAIEHYDLMIKIYGEANPKLQFQKGIAVLKKTKAQYLDGAAPKNFKDINQQFIGKKGFKNNNKFHEEVNKILGERPKFYSDQLNPMRNFMEFHLRPNAKIAKGVDVAKFAGKGVKVNKAEVVQALNKNKGKLAVQDHPSLNNIDWNVGYEKAINSILQKHPKAILEKLPREALASYQPKLVRGPEYLHGQALFQLSKMKHLRHARVAYSSSSSDTTSVNNTLPLDLNQDMYILYIPDFNPRKVYDDKLLATQESLLNWDFAPTQGGEEEEHNELDWNELQEALKSFMDEAKLNDGTDDSSGE